MAQLIPLVSGFPVCCRQKHTIWYRSFQPQHVMRNNFSYKWCSKQAVSQSPNKVIVMIAAGSSLPQQPPHPNPGSSLWETSAGHRRSCISHRLCEEPPPSMPSLPLLGCSLHILYDSELSFPCVGGVPERPQILLHTLSAQAGPNPSPWTQHCPAEAGHPEGPVDPCWGSKIAIHSL